MKLTLICAVILLFALPPFGLGQSHPDENSAAVTHPTPEKTNNQGTGKELRQGGKDIGKGAAKGTADLAKGTAAGAGDLIIGHPVNAAASTGKGAVGFGKNVGIGTGKGTVKIGKGIGGAFKKLGRKPRREADNR